MTKRFFLGLTITSLFFTAQAAQAVLLGHWKFDEASGATTAADSLTPGTNGAVGSGIITGLTGKVGNAYQFPGGASADDALDNPEIVDFDNALTVIPSILAADQMSVSVWFNWTTSPATRGTALSIASGTTNQNFIQMGVSGSASGHNSEGGIYGGINIAGTTTEVVNTTGSNPAPGGSLVFPEEVPIDGGTALNDGNWHHVVLTIDSATDVLKLYVDGVDVGTGRPATSAPGTPATINDFPATINNLEAGRLGRLSECCSYTGMVDDIQIYDRVLSATSVASLFANPGSVAALDGDFNNDGDVNAADYVLFRKHYGNPNSPLFNDSTPGVGDDDYFIWRQNFANAPAGSGVGSGANVPEPSALASGLMMLLTGTALASRKHSIPVGRLEGR